jgi:hypothetical protein
VDATTLLAILVAVMAVNTIAVVALLILTARDRLRRPTPAGPVPGRATTGIPASPPMIDRSGGSPSSVAETDALAGAISAFLGRSEGLFRTGERPSGPTGQPPPSPPHLPASAEPPRPIPTGGSGMTGGLDRSRPEVRWAPSRPSRYVPSGPRPGAPSTRAELPAAPVAAAAAPPGPPASRLEVRLVGRDPAAGAAAAGASARLGPVIGGLLRERTRSRDSVTADGPGRFSVVLPATTVDGAVSVASRLVGSCDAWLAAETPPLRLDIEVADLPGGVPSSDPDPARDSGPERRRSLVPRA